MRCFHKIAHCSCERSEPLIAHNMRNERWAMSGFEFTQLIRKQVQLQHASTLSYLEALGALVAWFQMLFVSIACVCFKQMMRLTYYFRAGSLKATKGLEVTRRNYFRDDHLRINGNHNSLCAACTKPLITHVSAANHSLLIHGHKKTLRSGGLLLAD